MGRYRKKIEFHKLGWHTLGLIVLLSVFSACGTNKIVSDVSSDSYANKKLLILPFKDLSKIDRETNNIRCPLCGNFFVTGEVLKDADIIMREHLVLLLKNNTDFILEPEKQVEKVLGNLLGENKQSLPELNLIVKAGKTLGADVIMAGYIYRFRQRLGTGYSVESPASVAFDIHLISAESGRLLWIGRFDETQRPLSNNLFQVGAFIKRKASWVTAEEMAFAGLEDMLKQFYRP